MEENFENSIANPFVIPSYSIWEKRENAFESPKNPPPSYEASFQNFVNFSEFGPSTFGRSVLELNPRDQSTVIIRNL